MQTQPEKTEPGRTGANHMASDMQQNVPSSAIVASALIETAFLLTDEQRHRFPTALSKQSSFLQFLGAARRSHAAHVYVFLSGSTKRTRIITI